MADPRLPRIRLGGTDLRVAPLGLAELFVPSSGLGGPRLDADAVEYAFHHHGINTFLLSPSMRATWEGVRRLIRTGHRDELVLVAGAGLPFAGCLRRALERRLRQLGTDHVDAWLLGWLRKRWHVRDGVWSAMRRLREEGKTRAIGFSTHDRTLAARLARELPADVIMIRYNASHRGAEREIFGPLEGMGAARPGVIAYTATRWGRLLRPLPERGLPMAMTGAECYRFALGHPMVDMAWCAARTPAELREDVAGALAGPLDPARREEIVRFGDAVHAAARLGRRWMFGSTAG